MEPFLTLQTAPDGKACETGQFFSLLRNHRGYQLSRINHLRKTLRISFEDLGTDSSLSSRHSIKGNFDHYLPLYCTQNSESKKSFEYSTVHHLSQLLHFNGGFIICSCHFPHPADSSSTESDHRSYSTRLRRLHVPDHRMPQIIAVCSRSHQS